VEDGRWISRTGGKVNDELYVTGQLGGSIRGKHLRFIPRVEESRWLVRSFQLHAMMDLSDGLGADLPRLAAASGVSFEVDESAIPRTRGCSIEQAISDGEDYELLFAMAPDNARVLERRWSAKFPKLQLTRIGRWVCRSSRSQALPPGYVHFA
jgi:thiamine-monophosphate kinase